MRKARNIIKASGSLVICGIFLLGFCSEIFAQDIPSSESFLKKYTLTESFELGMETAYKIPKRGLNTTNMGNIYLSLTHSTNSNSSFKFKTGMLNGEYLLKNQNIGRLYFVPVITTFMSSMQVFGLTNPKPYYGFGVGYYFFENFKSAQNQYRTYESENTYGYHYLVGAKYISPWGLLIRGDIGLEVIKKPRFFNSNKGVFGTRNVRRVNLTNLGFSLNMALYF